jgi:enoyl-CoA hydratase
MSKAEASRPAGRVTGHAEGAIGWVTFDNPGRRNAMSFEMWRALPEVLEAFGRDEAVRVVVLTGAGDQAFISGADISQFEALRGSAAANDAYSQATDAAFLALRDFEKPTIAMIRGFCIGGGLAVALNADLRIAGDDARFAIPAAKLGLGYGFDGVRHLTGIVGPAYAKEILFTARQFDAEEALRMGLVNRVVPTGALEAETRETAEAIAANAPLTISAAKRSVAAAMQDPDARDMDRIERAIADCFRSEDYAEGRRAFAEKRKPRFKGR